MARSTSRPRRGRSRRRERSERSRSHRDGRRDHDHSPDRRGEDGAPGRGGAEKAGRPSRFSDGPELGLAMPPALEAAPSARTAPAAGEASAAAPRADGEVATFSKEDLAKAIAEATASLEASLNRPKAVPSLVSSPPSKGTGVLDFCLPMTSGGKGQGMKVCVSYMGGRRCSWGESCPLKHHMEEKELAHWTEYFRKVTCKAGAVCSSLPQCVYFHPPEERARVVAAQMETGLPPPPMKTGEINSQCLSLLNAVAEKELRDVVGTAEVELTTGTAGPPGYHGGSMSKAAPLNGPTMISKGRTPVVVRPPGIKLAPSPEPAPPPALAPVEGGLPSVPMKTGEITPQCLSLLNAVAEKELRDAVMAEVELMTGTAGPPGYHGGSMSKAAPLNVPTTISKAKTPVVVRPPGTKLAPAPSPQAPQAPQPAPPPALAPALAPAPPQAPPALQEPQALQAATGWQAADAPPFGSLPPLQKFGAPQNSDFDPTTYVLATLGSDWSSAAARWRRLRELGTRSSLLAAADAAVEAMDDVTLLRPTIRLV